MDYRKLIPSILAVVVLLGAVFNAFFPLGSRDSSVFAIKAIPLVWSERLGGGRMESAITREIENQVGASFRDVMGRRAWEVDLEALGGRIRRLPWVRDARVARGLPDRLILSVSPKRPRAVLFDSSTSRLYPVVDSGELMAQWESDVVPDLPLMRGQGLGEKSSKGAELRAEVVRILDGLPHKGPFSYGNIAEVHYSDESGFSLMLSRPQTEVRLGRGEIETKIRRVGHVLNYLAVRSRTAPLVDSTSVKKVVVRAARHP